LVNFWEDVKVSNHFHWKSLGVKLGFQMVEVKNGNPEGRGQVSDFGIGRAWEVEYFEISEGKGVLKFSCCPW